MDNTWIEVYAAGSERCEELAAHYVAETYDLSEEGRPALVVNVQEGFSDRVVFTLKSVGKPSGPSCPREVVNVA